MLTLMLKDELSIFIEDIIDTGRILYLRDMFKYRKSQFSQNRNSF